MMKKIKSEFEFQCVFDAETNKFVTVLLTVDYKEKDFSMSSKFLTQFLSIKKEMGCAIPEWRALLKCMNMAIDFGEKELMMDTDPDLTEDDFEDGLLD